MSLQSAAFDPLKVFSRRDQVYTSSNRLGPNGDFERIVDEDVVVTTCANILGTKRGRRLMDCSFGTDLVKYCFRPLDEVTIDDIREEIINSIGMQEERAEINKIEISKTIDNGLAIKILLSISGVPKSLHFVVSPDAFAVIA
ncbi:MAG: hypothetical protein GXO10_06630 [Crenarchaeota archaeon]|nr:hypothetical protein [Thermoproteota archaeon]